MNLPVRENAPPRSGRKTMEMKVYIGPEQREGSTNTP